MIWLRGLRKNVGGKGESNNQRAWQNSLNQHPGKD
jgi:hypothetical protein